MVDEQENLAPATAKSLPDRMPGETGGFLRELSTRKLERKQGAPAPSTPTSEVPTSHPMSTSAAVSALDPNNHPLPQPAAAKYPLSNGSNNKVRLSAYEFYHRLRQCSTNSDPTVKHARQLELLAVRHLQYCL